MTEAAVCVVRACSQLLQTVTVITEGISSVWHEREGEGARPPLVGRGACAYFRWWKGPLLVEPPPSGYISPSLTNTPPSLWLHTVSHLTHTPAVPISSLLRSTWTLSLILTLLNSSWTVRPLDTTPGFRPLRARLRDITSDPGVATSCSRS